MKTHYLASLLGFSFACISAPSAAPAPGAPAAPPVRPTAACTFDGGVLFGITTRPNTKLVNGPTTSTTLFQGGGWTVVDGNGSRSGCLDRPAVDRLRGELRRATWNVTYAELVCLAVPSSFTEYVAFDKPVFTDSICSGSILDGESRAALDDAIRTLGAASAVKRTPAACRSLVPLFRIDHRADIPGHRTWSVEISVDGLVTFDATEDARHEHRTMCLFDDQLAQLKTNLAKQTWKLHRLSSTCAAFSPLHDVVSVHGKPVYDERMCEPDVLDAADAARLAAIRALIDQVTTANVQP